MSLLLQLFLFFSSQTSTKKQQKENVFFFHKTKQQPNCSKALYHPKNQGINSTSILIADQYNQMINLSTVVTQKKNKKQDCCQWQQQTTHKTNQMKLQQEKEKQQLRILFTVFPQLLFWCLFCIPEIPKSCLKIGPLCHTFSILLLLLQKCENCALHTDFFGVPSAPSIRRNIIPALRIDNPIDNQPEDKDQTLGDN